MSGPNGGTMVQRLRQHRPLLLACEAIGWLHMTGKAHPDFLRHHGGAGLSYEPKDWHRALTPAWRDQLAWVRPALGSLQLPDTLTDFLTRYDAGSSQASLVGLLQAGHAMASGIEKNVPSATSKYLNQDVMHMWLASPFGRPIRNLLVNRPPVLAQGGWEHLLQQIGELLENLRKLGEGQSHDESWRDWRGQAIGPRGWLRDAFLSTLAETRLPNNDVTLWDQSYVAAALFKSALAGAALAGCSNWQNLKSQTRWRVLSVALGSRHYEARAVKIGDWVGARRDIDSFFERARKLIEVDLALGSLVYRDQEDLVFTFPGLRQDAAGSNSNGSLDDASAEALRGEIERLIDASAKEYKFESPPLVRLSESTRSLVPMVKEIRQARNKIAVPLHRTWEIPDAEQVEGHVCPVCCVRCNGAKTEHRTENSRKQRVCSVCRDRRKGRLDAWLATGEDTIWISEVGDENDRVGLLTFSLDVEAWVGGKQVDSLRAQSVTDWRQANALLSEYWQRDPRQRKTIDNPIELRSSRDSILSHVIATLKTSAGNSYNIDAKNPDLVLANLQEGYRLAGTLDTFFARIVEDRADGPKWDELDEETRAIWLVHQLFRKLPSPGRIHRFWRTAETFFDELLTRFRELAAAHPNRWRTRRLALHSDEAPQNRGWQDRETYAGRWGEAPLEVLYRAEENDFVTISNLARCFRAEESEGMRQSRTLALTGDDDQLRWLQITNAQPAQEIGTYAPVIPLERSAESFRVLVPLDCANGCIEVAIEKWQDEFGRVWDRMPLRMGIVAFPRMTPFQAVIEAARSVEDQLQEAKPQWWRVASRDMRDGVVALELVREDGSRELRTVPVRLPDGRLDVFYPYSGVEGREPRFPLDFRHPDGLVYRHATDLRVGDGLRVHPARVATVFLDSTGRRFEEVTTRPVSDWRRMREVWQLVQRAKPSLSAVRGAWGELCIRREGWRDPEANLSPGAEKAWCDLVRAVLSKRWEVSGAALDELVETARSGILAWSLEWHLSALKERLTEAINV